MFYLVHFYKTLFSKPLLGFLWVFAIAGLIGSVTFEKKIKNALGQTKVESKNPYFYAVMPANINTSYIQRKLKGLPGVESVYLLNKESVGEQVKAILESTQIEWDQELLNLNFAGIKVDLSPDLKGRSQDLIRSYINRLAGDKEVTLGAIQKPLNLSKKMPINWLQVISDYTGLIFIGLSLMVLWANMSHLGKESFLIETYQRRSRVFERSFFFGQAPIITALALGAALKGGVLLFALGIYLIGMVVLFGIGSKFRRWA